MDSTGSTFVWHQQWDSLLEQDLGGEQGDTCGSDDDGDGDDGDGCDIVVYMTFTMSYA